MEVEGEEFAQPANLEELKQQLARVDAMWVRFQRRLARRWTAAHAGETAVAVGAGGGQEAGSGHQGPGHLQQHPQGYQQQQQGFPQHPAGMMQGGSGGMQHQEQGAGMVPVMSIHQAPVRGSGRHEDVNMIAAAAVAVAAEGGAAGPQLQQVLQQMGRENLQGAIALLQSSMQQQ
jgi:hypothetical protein